MFLWTTNGMWGVTSLGLMVQPLMGSQRLTSVPPYASGTMPTHPDADDCYISAGHGYRCIGVQRNERKGASSRPPSGSFLLYADIVGRTQVDATRHDMDMNTTQLTDDMLSPSTLHRLLRDAQRILDNDDEEREAIATLFAALRASKTPKREYDLYASEPGTAPHECRNVGEERPHVEQRNAIPPPALKEEDM